MQARTGRIFGYFGNALTGGPRVIPVDCPKKKTINV